MKEDFKVKKTDKERELLKPDLYPPLTRNIELNRFNNSNRLISKILLAEEDEYLKNKEIYAELEENINPIAMETLQTAKYDLELLSLKSKCLFKRLIDSENTDLVNQRRHYFKRIVVDNEYCFPQELKLDKLFKKSTHTNNANRKKNNKAYFEQLSKEVTNAMNKNTKKTNNNNKKLNNNTSNADTTKREKDSNKKNVSSKRFEEDVDEDNEYKTMGTKPSNKKLVSKVDKNIAAFSDNENEEPYDTLKRKESIYQEKYRRDSLDMFEYTKTGLLDRNFIGDNKNIQDDDVNYEENKSDEKSFNDEYEDQSEDNFDDDDGDYRDAQDFSD